MTNANFIVARVDGFWIVSGVGTGFRQVCRERTDAIRVAVQAASECCQNGDDAQVLGLDRESRLYPIWNYGAGGRGRPAFVTNRD
jgi:hypothetical protein